MSDRLDTCSIDVLVPQGHSRHTLYLVLQGLTDYGRGVTHLVLGFTGLTDYGRGVTHLVPGFTGINRL